ncbi:acyl-CoA dehydrogenase [Acidiphilium sp. PA]|nr:acyl-CoA dehydrogenase [Acidiphilium sp. PA]
MSAILPALQRQAIIDDALAAFPTESFERLQKLGLLRAPLPVALGGAGLGDGATGASALLRVLTLLGEASLPVARLYEAHVNALQLVCRYAQDRLIRRCARDAGAGALFALWVTDPPESTLAMHRDGDGYRLEGSKAFCSGAGIATRALITAAMPSGIRMLIIDVEPGTRVLPSPIKLSGMRAAITGSIDLTGIHVPADALLGEDGDYLREPVFSAGAWRSAAAALGGLKALVEIHRGEILRRGRAQDPHQQARFGALVMAYETSRLWMAQAALRACLEDDDAGAIVAYVNLARLAVESACLDAMRLSQRSLGLGAFIAGHPAERVCRDLATYLRQPAPDETLVKAASHYFHTQLPGTARAGAA